MVHRRTLASFVGLLGIFFLPQTVCGAVHISEIAWMGSVDSSSDEWIELWNDGPLPIDLSGWTLVAIDGSPSLTLSGTIPSGGYFLIERTDDDTLPGVTADLVVAFGSGLSNAGETLRLRDTSGASIDDVTGGENWTTVGGDNETKATAQRTSSGWVTAPGTPRAMNSTVSVQGTLPTATGSYQTSTTSPSTLSTTDANGTVRVSSSPYPRGNITVIASEDLRVYVGAPVSFVGNAKGLYDEPIPHATYRWNFGDGTVGTGNPATHTYTHEGRYLAVLDVLWGEKHATDNVTVTVTQAEVVVSSVATTSEGVIRIKNVSSRDIDLSSWVLTTGSSTHFIFPQHTFLLSGGELPLAIALTAVPPGTDFLELRYPNGHIASTFTRSIENRVLFAPKRETVVPTPAMKVLGSSLEETAGTQEVYSGVKENQVVSRASSPGHVSILSPWAGLFTTLVLLGIVTTLYIRSLRTIPIAETYALTEDETG